MLLNIIVVFQLKLLLRRKYLCSCLEFVINLFFIHIDIEAQAINLYTSITIRNQLLSQFIMQQKLLLSIV